MPYRSSSGRNPIHPNKVAAPKCRIALTASPTTRFSSSDTPTTCTIFSCSFAPRYCEQSTDVPMFITSNTRKANMTIWFTTPTAATLSSEYWLSMIVSTAPSIIIRRVSIKMGTTSLVSPRRTFVC